VVEEQGYDGPSRKLYRPRYGIVAVVALKKLFIIKAALAAITFVVYANLMTWQGALVFITGLCIHECGHIWAMRRIGIPTSGFYLIPFTGGICSPKRPFEHRFEEAFVAAMGPVFGLLSLPFCFVIGDALTGSTSHAASLAAIIAFVNLFNLLPIVPLDGGRIIRASVASFSTKLGVMLVVCGGVAAAYLAYTCHIEILILVAGFSVLELVGEIRRGDDIKGMDVGQALFWIAAYLAIGAMTAAAYYGLTVIQAGT
jgi:Zn-dependent protease